MNLFVLLCIIVFIFISISISIFIYSRNRNQIENFYTLFHPYYFPATIDKLNSLTQKDKTTPYILNVLISPQQYKYTNIKLFLKSFISYKYPIINVNLFTHNYPTILNNNYDENTISIMPAPLLVNVNHDDYKFITTLDEQYIYIIAPINKNLNTLTDLDNKIIGVGEKESLWDICAEDVFRNAQINYKKYHGTLRETLQNLYNGKIDAMLITDNFPSYLLNYIFYNFYNLRLISLDKLSNMDFYYTRSQIDLSKLPALYLPNATFKQKNRLLSSFNNFNRMEQKNNFYNPLITTYKFINYVITNNKMNSNLAYLLTDHIFKNKLMLDKSSNAFTFIPIEFQEGAKKYYISNGLISYSDSEKCIKLYGKNVCNNKTIGDIREDII